MDRRLSDFYCVFAAFTYCYMVLNPVKDFLASTGVRINACVPLFLFEYSYSKFFYCCFAYCCFAMRLFQQNTADAAASIGKNLLVYR